MNGPKVVAALTQAIDERGAAPDSITLDNGSEFAGACDGMQAIQTGVQRCSSGWQTRGEWLHRKLQRAASR